MPSLKQILGTRKLQNRINIYGEIALVRIGEHIDLADVNDVRSLSGERAGRIEGVISPQHPARNMQPEMAGVAGSATKYGLQNWGGAVRDDRLACCC